ncbi:MAG: AAA family ATPase [Acidobacteriota bacterium]
MRKAASFVPPHLVASLASGGPRSLPHRESFPAALLFSDIAGFTALTERLQDRGRAGAEEIAMVVDRAFLPAIRAIAAGGGSIVSFGGDALFSLFPGAGAAARALDAAESIRLAFRRAVAARGIEPVRLGISQAVHFGRVEGWHLGSASRRHYLIAGSPVAMLARLAGRSSAGKIVVSRAARRAARRETIARRPGPVAAPSRSLACYLPRSLFPLPPGFSGAFREASILFLETRPAPLSRTSAYVEVLLETLDRFGGALLKSDISASGVKWIGAFGIPAAHEDDPARAAWAALEVLRRLPDGMAVRGGLHAGTVANVLVGTRTRRSFDVMGDVVNTAARALGKAAWGEVLATESVCDRLQGIETADRGAHAVKGKAQPLALRALVAARPVPKALRASVPLVGRAAELRRLVVRLEDARSGRGSVVALTGHAGIGKSRLAHEAAVAARSMGFDVHEAAVPAFGHEPYAAIASLLRRAVGGHDGSDARETARLLASTCRQLRVPPADRHRLGAILGIPAGGPDREPLKGEDARLAAMSAIRSFLGALARRCPRLLVIDDAHGADSATRAAMSSLSRAAHETRYVLLLLSRSGDGLPPDAEILELRDLERAHTEALAGALLGDASDDDLAFVRDRAGGNPLFVEELARVVRDARGGAASGIGGQRVPEPDGFSRSVEALIASRLDRLPLVARRCLQVAAVVGRAFLWTSSQRSRGSPVQGAPATSSSRRG